MTSDIRHFTASAVVLHGTDCVLLVHHNKLNLWLVYGWCRRPDVDLRYAPAFTHDVMID